MEEEDQFILSDARKLVVDVDSMELDYYQEKHLLFQNGEAFVIQTPTSSKNDDSFTSSFTQGVEVSPSFILEQTLGGEPIQLEDAGEKSELVVTEKILPRLKTIQCDFCSYTTSRRSHLNEHTRMIHLKLKTICDLCGKRFSNINQHMRVVHKVLRSGLISKKKCGECNKEFYDLTKHMAKAHSLKYVYEFSCKQCNIKFNSRYSLNRHNTRKHMQKGECSECGKKFVNLHSHISKMHHGSMLHACPYCCRIFKRKMGLAKHLEYCAEVKGSVDHAVEEALEEVKASLVDHSLAESLSQPLTDSAISIPADPSLSAALTSLVSSSPALLSVTTVDSLDLGGLTAAAPVPGLPAPVAAAASVSVAAAGGGVVLVNNNGAKLHQEKDNLLLTEDSLYNETAGAVVAGAGEETDSATTPVFLALSATADGVDAETSDGDGGRGQPFPSPVILSGFDTETALASLAGKGGSTTPTIMTTFKDDTPDKMVEEEMGAVSTSSQAPLSQLYQIPGMTNGQFRLDTLSLLESDNQNVIQCSGLDETVLEDVKRLAKKKGRSNPMVVCRVCPGQKLVRNIQKHMDKFHTVKPKKQKETSRYQCELCGYKTDRVANFTSHVKIVHLKEKTMCQFCGKAYTNIYQHIRVVHKILKSGPKTKERCGLCGQEYYDLQQHLQRAHKIVKEQRDTTCSYCGDKFSKYSNMVRHIKRIHQKIRETCQVCLKHVANLKKHMKTHKDLLLPGTTAGSQATQAFVLDTASSSPASLHGLAVPATSLMTSLGAAPNLIATSSPSSVSLTGSPHTGLLAPASILTSSQSSSSAAALAPPSHFLLSPPTPLAPSPPAAALGSLPTAAASSSAAIVNLIPSNLSPLPIHMLATSVVEAPPTDAAAANDKSESDVVADILGEAAVAADEEGETKQLQLILLQQK